MELCVLGDHPFARNGQGRLRTCIATIFPRSRVLVTLPGIHATQRIAHTDRLNEQRRGAGLPPLTPEQTQAEWQQSVDLIMDSDTIQIRPEPDRMSLAFEADEALQELVSKRKIRFLNVMNRRVRQAIKERGENWRIAVLPRSPQAMQNMIRDSRARIRGRALYYYNRMSGTRYLTYSEFEALESLTDDELAAHLDEIREFAGRDNRRGYAEVAFFGVEAGFGHQDFAGFDFLHAPGADLRARYERLRGRFADAVAPELRRDDLDDLKWRNQMFAALISQRDEAISEEILLGLSPEFYMQIEWLPGGRIEEGELLLDSTFDEYDKDPDSPELASLCDTKARGFIMNILQEFGDLEYVNIGRVIGSLSWTRPEGSDRNVYVAEIKLRTEETPFVRILRLQKWGIRQRLDDPDDPRDMLRAITESEDYTDYILDRRLGCRQLGMNLPSHVTLRRLSERYHGPRREYEGRVIWSTYFEREYVRGVATDKIPVSRYRNPEYGLRLARLLGRAAATNIIVGRTSSRNEHVLFDDGDEVVTEDERGLPRDLVVADHTGTFGDYMSDPLRYAAEYAEPINRRLAHTPNPRACVRAYIDALVERYLYIQHEYRKRKRAFDTLFKHRPRDEKGSFAYRWEKVLERLDRTDPEALGTLIESHIRLP